MRVEPHVLAKIDVSDPRIAFYNQHVLIVGFGTCFAEIRGPCYDYRLVRQWVYQHELEVDPLDVYVPRDAIKLFQPLVKIIQRNSIAYGDGNVGAGLKLSDSCDLRVFALTILFLLHQAKP